jgi:hypothetical protein
MKFETVYKNINFHITIEKALVSLTSLLLGDKFTRLAKQTVNELKIGHLVAFNLIIISSKESEERTHYWSNILLTSNEDELLDELGFYLDDEDILDAIVANWELVGDESGPSWK